MPASGSRTRWPRIGAFEVCFTLRNRTCGASYGPHPVYSKLQTGRWPLHTKLVQRLDEKLQELLKDDAHRFAFETAVRQQIIDDKAPKRRPLMAADIADEPATPDG